MRSFKSLAVLVSAFVFAGSVVGCDDSGTDGPDPVGGEGAGGEGGGPIEPEEGMAMVRVVHSSSDAPAAPPSTSRSSMRPQPGTASGC